MGHSFRDAHSLSNTDSKNATTPVKFIAIIILPVLHSIIVFLMNGQTSLIGSGVVHTETRALPVIKYDIFAAVQYNHQ